MGSVLGSTLELSNVDLAEQFVQLIKTQQAFQASARVISTTDDLADGNGQPDALTVNALNTKPGPSRSGFFIGRNKNPDPSLLRLLRMTERSFLLSF